MKRIVQILTLLTPAILLSLITTWEGYGQGCKPIVNLGDTIAFCAGNSITLNVSNPNSSYLWSTGDTTSSLTINSSGSFWVSVTNQCGTTNDTVEVLVDNPQVFNLGPTQFICSGSSYVITPPFANGNSYLWQDGSTLPTYTVTQTGKYYVKLDNSCGSYADTLYVTVENAPVLNLGSDIIKCDTSSVTLNSGTAGYAVNWSTGATGDSIVINNSGTYWASITNSCGTFYDTINVQYSAGTNFDLGDTADLCSGGSLTLSTFATSGSHLWSTGATTKSITVSTAGTYWVRLIDVCGTYYDTIVVTVSGAANINLGSDTTFCSGSPLILDAGYPGSIYLWSTGDTNRTIAVNQTGSYWVGVDNGCGFQYDTINTIAITAPAAIIPSQLTMCQGSTRLVDAGVWGPQTTYTWSDGTNGQTKTYALAGNYSVTISNPCGTYTNNFSIVYDNTLNIDLGQDDTVCVRPFTLRAGFFINPSDSILWSTGDTTTQISINGTGTYWVRVENSCGVFTDTVSHYFMNPPGTLLPDTASLCNGSSVTLEAKFEPYTDYLWSTGATVRTISVSNPGTYWVKVSNYCGTLYDTVYVLQQAPLTVNFGPDVSICEPNVHVLDLSALNADSIIWSNGASGDSITVTQTGTYYAIAINSCGAYSDTIDINIDELPKKNLTNRAFCIGGSTILDASQTTSSTFLWNTSSTQSSISVNQSGWYYVDITNGCGTIRDSSYVRVDQFLTNPNLGPDTIFCQGTLVLDPGFIEGVTYLWQDGSTNQTFTVTQSGTYYVQMQNSCNSVYDTIDVLITGPPTAILGSKVKFCFGSILTLNAQNPGSSYLWSTGATSQSLSIDSGGVYWVTITNDCGSATDTVEAVVEYILDDINLGNDTIICFGDRLVLRTGYPGVTTRWQDGSGLDSVVVNGTGWYHATIRNTCGRWTDSVYVEVQDIPVFTLGNDTVICALGGSLLLSGPDSLGSYQWSTGDTSKSITITTEGNYWLTVSNKCFSFTDTLRVIGEYPIDVNLGRDLVLCATQPHILNPGIIPYDVVWSTGVTQPTLEISKSGTYWASATNSCGTFYDTVSIKFDFVLDPPSTDTLICNGDTAVFDLSDADFDYIWFDGSRDTVRYFTDPGTYPLEIINACGTFEKDFVVSISNCDCPFFVPNAFTPNGDGTNDEFFIGHSCPIDIYSIQIFTKWGALVYESDDFNEGWDGTTLDGNEASPGTYSYKITYQYITYGLDRNKIDYGSITLMR